MAESAAIFVAAFVVRWLHLEAIRHAPFFTNLQTNSHRYHEWARLIVAGTPPPPPYDQSPGYPYVVALVYRFLGESVTSLALVQCLLDSAACVGIAWLTARLLGRRAGRLAAILAVGCGSLIYFAGEILPATVSIALTVATLVAAADDRWILSGILCSAGVLVRSEILLVLPFLVMVAKRREERLATFSVVAPSLAVIAMLAILTWMDSRHFLPLPIGSGLNLWIGNHPGADGVNPFVDGTLAVTAQQIQAASHGDPVVADRLFLEKALEFWRDDPTAAIGLAVKKFAWTWSRRELPNTSDIDWQTAQSWLFGIPALPFGFGLIAPLGLGGLWLLRRRTRELAILLGPLCAGLVTCTLFFTNARFRLIMVPSLICSAAFCIEQLWVRRQRIERGAILAIGAGIVLAWGDVAGVQSYFIPQIEANIGVIEREAGNYAAAVAHLRRALEAAPEDAISWIHLALALEQSGDVDGAIDAYLGGLERLEESPDLRRMAQQAFARNRIPLSLLAEFLGGTTEEARKASALSIHRSIPSRQGN